MAWGPQGSGNAMTGRKSTLPPIGDLLDDLHNGLNTNDMAGIYGVSAGRIKQTITAAGYSSRTGEPLGATDEIADLAAALPFPGAWVADALCAQVDPELFFPEKGGSTREAKLVCARCPVAADCLDYALALPNSHDYGIFGGTSPKQRRKLRKALDADAAGMAAIAHDQTHREAS